MKKNLHYLRSFLMLFVLLHAFSARAAVIPYLPALQNFGGTSVDLVTFSPIIGDYTLEVQGTVDTPISVAGGVITYTPTTNSVVRFAQKSGKISVYEGNVFKTTLTPNSVAITYPTVYDDANLSGIYNAANLIANPGFETTSGPNLNTATDQRYAAATWMLSSTGAFPSFTSSGVRVNVDNASYVTGREGLATLLWRNDGATANNTNTYFYQSLGSKLKANTTYKIKFHVLTHNQGKSCNWRVGVGSTSGGYQYSLNVFNTVSTNFTSKSYEYTFTTPSVVAGETFFTIGNNGDATSTNWTIIHFDRITLVEGSAPKGITGVTTASFLDGTAYAPENVPVDFSAGDSYDMTSFIKNASFEDVQADKQQTIPNWTKTGTANSEYCTRNDAGPAGFKTGNVYFQYWSGATPKPDFSISQIITGLPNGKYRVTAAAGGDAGTTGTYVYAQDNQTQVTSTGDFSAEAVVLDGSLTIGFKSVNRSVSWAFADNFRLYYLGVSADPVLTLSATSFYYDANNLTKTFNVSGANLTGDVTLTAPEGITLSKTTLTAAEAQAGVNITAQFTGSASIKGGTISVASGVLTKSISVTALYGDGGCFSPLYNNRTNLVTEPFCNDRSKFGGWGNVGISELTKFCGERSLKVFGGSLDVSVASGAAIASNKTYRVKAKIFVPGAHTAKFGLFLIGNTADVDVYNSTTNDAWETADFTFKTATVGAGGVFFQRSSGTDSVYIDNYEMYEVAEPTVRVKYVDAADVNTSIKADRVYTATWGTTLANYLTIGKTYSALTADKAVVTYGGYNYDYDNTSVENVTVAEGENVIVLKFIKGLSTGNVNLGNNEVAVYPTMTDENVNVSLSGKTGTIRVFDVAGRIVATKVANSTKEVVSLPSSGVFFIEVNSNNVTKTFKVIRMK
ncbi:MAG TPA: T9SS type A sorting domain-containing protein [Paludibacter sp.]